MSEKLTESITFKCTYERKQKALRIFKAKKMNSLSEYIDSLLTKDISEVEDYLNTLIPVLSVTTDTEVTSDFELSQEPLPRPNAQKKSHFCDQLSFMALYSQKH